MNVVVFQGGRARGLSPIPDDIKLAERAGGHTQKKCQGCHPRGEKHPGAVVSSLRAGMRMAAGTNIFVPHCDFRVKMNTF